ncbi:Prohibitin [Microtus ochrogaster]|uniref:Prohibitin n=1 Tax=Microtus ochrogaster TaxID=79684 RepID=A0A8J6GGX1_MICOH|nr:Prohibitin [Microtus ochrogaster]
MYQSSLVAKICRISISHYPSSSSRWPASFLIYTSESTRIMMSGAAIHHSREILKSVSDDLTERAPTFGLTLDDVSLTYLTFGKAFHRSSGSQKGGSAGSRGGQICVEKAGQQTKAAIIFAEGDSKAAGLIINSLAMAGDGLIELRKLEAAEDIAYQLSCSRNITYLPVGQSLLLQLTQ